MDDDSRVLHEAQIPGLTSCVGTSFSSANAEGRCDCFAAECSGPKVREPLRSLRLSAEQVRSLLALRSFIERIVCRARPRPCDVSDLVQLVWIEVIADAKKREAHANHRREIDDLANVSLIARRVASRYRGKMARRREVMGVEWREVVDLATMHFEMRPTAPTPQGTLLDNERERVLVAELDFNILSAATKPPFWRAFYGHVVLNVPVVDIAAAERVPMPTIYNRIRLARLDLRAAIRHVRAANRAA